MKKNSICIISHLYPIDTRDYKGSFVKDLANAMVDHDILVHVVTPMRPGAKIQERLNGVNVYRFPFFGWRDGQQLGQMKGVPIIKLGSMIVIGILKALQIILKEKTHVLHAYWVVPAGFIAAIVGGITNKPVVATAAGSDIEMACSNAFIKSITKITFWSLTGLITVSDYLKEKAGLLGISDSKVTVIPGPVGINMKLFSSPAFLIARGDNALRLLHVGNLENPKRIDTLIRAMGHLKKRNIKFNFTIAGEGSLSYSLKSLAKEVGVHEHIFFIGRVEHERIPNLMQSSHIFLHCSEREGLSVANMEAMAAGLPVIAAGVGGVPTLVKDGVTGYCLDFEDDYGFAEKIMLFASEDKLRIKMGRKAYFFIKENFNKKKIISNNIDVYKSICKGF